MKARVTGIGEVKKALLRLSGEGEKAVKREVLRAALAVQTGAKRAVPVDTGRLRNSIAVEFLDEGLAARVGTNVEYAPFVEFGTRRMGARPYLFPAFEATWPDFVARLSRELGGTVVGASL